MILSKGRSSSNINNLFLKSSWERMMRFLALFAVAARAQFAPVTFNNQPGVSPACAELTCGPLECIKPFKWISAQDAGTCCPICFSEEVKIPVPKPQLPEGEPLHGSAPTSCMGPKPVYCPTLHCGESDRVYEEGSCCSVCAVE